MKSFFAAVALAFAACVPAQVLIDFETFPDGTPVPIDSASLSNQWSSIGIIISDSSPEDGASAFTGVAGLPAHSGSRALSFSEDGPDGFLLFSFVVPGTTQPGTVPGASFWVQNNDTGGSIVTFFGPDGSVLFATNTAASPTLEAFVHYFGASNGIAFIRIEDSDYFIVDDFELGNISPVPVSTERIRGGRIVASWPSVYSNYTLQVAKHINRRRPDKTRWTTVTGTPGLSGNYYSVTNRVSQGRFFRLVAQ